MQEPADKPETRQPVRLSVVDREAEGIDAFPRRMTRRGVISRDRIIDAGLDLLAEGGYAALSIGNVTKRAEVSAASLYHHFGDKAGLCAALVEESIVRTIRLFADYMLDKEDPAEKLSSYITATLEIGRERRDDAISVLLAMTQASNESEEVARAVQEARARAWRFAAGEFSDRLGIEDGMLLSHLQFAFASYISQVAQSSTSKDDAKAIFKSFYRVMYITAAALRPEFMNDPEFRRVLSDVSKDRPTV